MHEINDVLTPKELKALTLREAGYTFIRMKKEFDVSATGVQRYYQRARRKQEKWLEYNAPQSSLLLKLLLPITNQIKELTK
jgi:DNA-directed RNA polymerase specialized sigma24 family protein